MASLAKFMMPLYSNDKLKFFNTSDLQFGLKDGLSTKLSYYVSNGSTVHVLLINKGMFPLVVRLLLHMYTNQKLKVIWNDAMSNRFNVKNWIAKEVSCLLLFG